MGFWGFLGGDDKATQTKAEEAKKRRAEFNIDEYQEEPFMAYLERVGPKDARMRDVVGKLPQVDDIHSAEELHEAIRPRHGGGQYKAKCFVQHDRTQYLATYNFTLPGEPLLEGRPIPMPEVEDKGKGKKGKVAEIDQKREELKATKEYEAEKAELEKERATHGTQVTALAEQHQEQIAALQAQLVEVREGFEEQLAEREEEDERRKAERERKEEREELRDEMRQEREANDKRFAELLGTLKGEKTESAQAQNLQVLMTAMQESAKTQMEMMKQIMEGIREQSTTMIGFLSKPSTAQLEATESRRELMQTLRAQLESIQAGGDAKLDRTMDFFLRLRELALQDTGGSESVWAGAAKEVAGSITGAVTMLAERQKGAAGPSPESIKAQARQGANEAIAKARQATRARIEHAKRREAAQPEPEPEPTPEPQPERELEQNPEQSTTKAAANELVGLMIKEVDETGAPTWPQFAATALPKDLLDTLIGGDSEKAMGVLGQYVDEAKLNWFETKMRTDPRAFVRFAEGVKQLQELVGD